MKKGFWLVWIFCCSVSGALAQDSDSASGFQREKLFVGGNFGLTFGSYTFINISPQIGYRFNRFLAAGTGINFQYVSQKSRDFNGDLAFKVTQGVTGLNVFGRVYPVNQVMLQVQPEMNYVFGKQVFYQPEREENKLAGLWVPSLLAGGGLVLPAGRSAMIIGLFYDVLQKENAPYGNKPIVTFSYNVGL